MHEFAGLRFTRARGSTHALCTALHDADAAESTARREASGRPLRVLAHDGRAGAAARALPQVAAQRADKKPKARFGRPNLALEKFAFPVHASPYSGGRVRLSSESGPHGALIARCALVHQVSELGRSRRARAVRAGGLGASRGSYPHELQRTDRAMHDLAFDAPRERQRTSC